MESIIYYSDMHFDLDLIIAEQESQRCAVAIFHLGASEIISSTYIELFPLARRHLFGGELGRGINSKKLKY